MKSVNDIENELISEAPLYSWQDKKYQTRISNALKKYKEIFNNEDVLILSVPSRIEICGNHTDHNGGKVLASGISLDLLIITGKSNDDIIRVYSENIKRKITVDISDKKNLEISDKDVQSPVAIIKGIAAGFKKRNLNCHGFNAYVESIIPIGSGLSSSAAFEIALCSAINHLYNENKLETLELAKIAHESENNYFKKPCGLLDQIACSYAGFIKIDFKDMLNPVIKSTEACLDKFSIFLVNTGGSHEGLSEEYSSIKSDMHRVAAFFNKQKLSELQKKELEKNQEEIIKSCSIKSFLRAEHFFNENNRVDNLFSYFSDKKNTDTEIFFKIINESHNSCIQFLQNIITDDNKIKQNLNLGMALSREFLGDFGAVRITGGGFAGCFIAYVKNEKAEEYKSFMKKYLGKESVMELYPRKEGVVRLI